MKQYLQDKIPAINNVKLIFLKYIADLLILYYLVCIPRIGTLSSYDIQSLLKQENLLQPGRFTDGARTVGVPIVIKWLRLIKHDNVFP